MQETLEALQGFALVVLKFSRLPQRQFSVSPGDVALAMCFTDVAGGVPRVIQWIMHHSDPFGMVFAIGKGTFRAFHASCI